MNEIQQAQYELEQAKLWLINHCYVIANGNVFQITFNHMHYNAVDLVKIYAEKKSIINDHFQQNHEQQFVIDKDRLYISIINNIPDRKFQFTGSCNIKAKQVIQFFYNIWPKQFYIPIDMSHLDGSPCLLNYVFNKRLSFQENWNQVKKIKKNQHNFLFNKNTQGQAQWKKYLNTEKAWLSIINNQNSEDVICFQRYAYDDSFLQGLGIIINKNDSRWTFSFFADPQMINCFIEKYNLVKI